VRCDPCDGLDPRVAAAAYAIASESVVNAARHSGADECRLTVRLLDGHVLVTCEDDGRGIAPDATRGVGSRSVRERTEELGGRVEVTTVRPDVERPGTRVRATLPLVPAGALARAREGAS
jgi:signal transduction histidine kinase